MLYLCIVKVALPLIPPACLCEIVHRLTTPSLPV